MTLLLQKTFSLFVFVFFLHVLILSSVLAQQAPQFQFEQSFGQKGIEQGELNSPQGISVGINGIIYIADTGNNRIQQFSADGNFLNFIGGFGWNTAQFDEPVAIWAKNGLQVFVADKNNHRILHYDRNLNVVSTAGEKVLTDESLKFRYPVGVARSTQGDLFVIDSENNRVIRLDAFGTSETSFGGYNASGKTLLQPVNIIVWDSETIYVSDAGRREVVVYDYFGNYHHSLGTGVFRYPAGLDVDEKGTLFVCDKEASQIVVFNSSGHMISKLMHPTITVPVDIAYARNRVYILDQENAGVSVFKVQYLKSK